MKKGGYVYVLADYNKEGIYKIGVTRGSVENRVKKLQTGNSGEIYIYSKRYVDYPFYIEKRLHMSFSKKNVLNEWFELSMEDLKSLNSLIDKEEKIIEALKDNEFFTKQLK